MQETLGIVFWSNESAPSSADKSEFKLFETMKPSLVVIITVIAHTHERSFVGQILHLGASNTWLNWCSPSHRPRSRHERKPQVTIKVAKSQWTQQRSASLHSLLTPDSETYWKCKCCLAEMLWEFWCLASQVLTPLICQSASFCCWPLTLNQAKAHSQQWKKRSRRASREQNRTSLTPVESR